MSGYPYGGPPPTQPYGGGGYGAPPAGYGVPYGAGAPPAAGEKPSKPHKGGDYNPSAPPSSAPYGGYGDPYAAASSQYAGEKPSKTGYQPSAPPAAGPYGGYADPYSAGSEKPSKAQQGGGYGDPYSEKPSKAQQGGGYGDPYSEKPSKAQQGYGDPYGSGGSPYGSGGSPYDKPSKMQQGGGYQGAPPPQGGGYQGVPPPQGGGYQGAPPQGPYGGTPYGASPFAALVPSAFPPGTDPNVVACFQAADHDGSGFIDDTELQGALSSYNQSFRMRTVHLLMYLFTSSNVRKIGPKEFTSVFYSLQSWRGIFDRADRDRSGKIDAPELRDALMSLGFAVSPVVLDLLVSKFDKSGGKNKAIEYDGFIECCLIVKGLTEKFKEKDVGFRGSATFTYESFMLTVLPFLVA